MSFDEELLIRAVEFGDEDKVRSILDKISPDSPDGFLMSIAAENGDIDMISLLLEYNIDIDETAPIVEAAINGHFNAVKMLANAGADIHINNDKAVRRAFKDDRIDIVEFLVTESLYDSVTYRYNEGILYIFGNPHKDHGGFDYPAWSSCRNKECLRDVA